MFRSKCKTRLVLATAALLVGSNVALAQPAKIIVRLPADAQVFIDGTPTQQTGSMRVFNTPALDPGHSYSYKITVQATRNGQPVTRFQNVPVQSGRTHEIAFNDFNSASGSRQGQLSTTSNASAINSNSSPASTGNLSNGALAFNNAGGGGFGGNGFGGSSFGSGGFGGGIGGGASSGGASGGGRVIVGNATQGSFHELRFNKDGSHTVVPVRASAHVTGGTSSPQHFHPSSTHPVNHAASHAVGHSGGHKSR